MCNTHATNIVYDITVVSPSQTRAHRQLDDLVAQLGDTEPHYIKCIKPNSAKAPGGWSSALVIQQLRYSGVLEARATF